ncbi:Gastric triacylglycerol lipase [Halotydeus destructor]|nr:Gastric triacylglycerol lipase [Halotydeus destructor]
MSSDEGQVSEANNDDKSHWRELSVYLKYLDKFRMVLPSSSKDADLDRDTLALITSRGFVCECHEVTTEDGYILTAHRIVHPKRISVDRGPPVILQHGLLSSSRDFICNSVGGGIIETSNESQQSSDDVPSVGNNLGFELAKRGYDVWLTNSRGNVYSRRHISLDADKDKSYWDFCFDHMIEYDTPAFIDHILKVTSKKTVAYIGHSQGCLIMFGLLSTQEKYNNIIKPFIALSPVTTVGFIKSPIKYLADQYILLSLFRRIGGPFLPSSSLINTLASRSNFVPQGLWTSNFTFFFGYNSLDFSRLPVYMSHTPAGTSTRNVLHFAQGFVSKAFRKYDHGSPEANMAAYGQPLPPEYPLENITNKHIAIFSSKSDWFCDPEDVKLLRSRLAVDLYEDYEIPDERWNHLDFLWGKELGKLVNVKVLDILKKLYPGS